MPVRGLDYSGKIPGNILREAGIQDVFRYLGDPAAWAKAMTLDEVNDLVRNGIRIHLNYEQTADFMLGGYSAGINYAHEARKWANALGFFKNETIYYSADFDAQPNQIPTLMDFLRGAVYAEGSQSAVGIYGGINVVKPAIDAGYRAWQAGAWSNGKRDSRAIAWQDLGTMFLVGVDCDVNEMNTGQGVTPVTDPSSVIPQSVRDAFPDVAAQFNGTYDIGTAALWADAGARAAALRTNQILQKLDSIPQVSGVNLSQGDINAIAVAVVKELGKAASAG